VSPARDTAAEIAVQAKGDGQQAADHDTPTDAGPDLPAPGEAPAAAAADGPDLPDLPDLSAPDPAFPAHTADDEWAEAAATNGDTTEGDR
jgi:hypothetical protein